MNNLYQTWVTGGSYAIAQDSYMVKERKLNKPSDESSFVCEWVDLGLPSGMLWADRNIGAAAPEEFGLYFAWGETEGFTIQQIQEGIRSFNWEDYKFGNPVSKYNDTDGLIFLQEVDDAAYQIDNTYRIPTVQAFDELINNTTATTETINGVKGDRIISTINGNSIFVPHGGIGGDAVGIFGTLWTSSLVEGHGYDGYHAYNVIFDHGPMIASSYFDGRRLGMNIRPVTIKNIN